jgi:hypothetical protein
VAQTFLVQQSLSWCIWVRWYLSLLCRADLKHVSDTIQSHIERCFAHVMDYGLYIGTMHSFAAAKTSGPAFRVETKSINKKKTEISVNTIPSLYLFYISVQAYCNIWRAFLSGSRNQEENNPSSSSPPPISPFLLFLLLALHLPNPCTPSSYFKLLLPLPSPTPSHPPV